MKVVLMGKVGELKKGTGGSADIHRMASSASFHVTYYISAMQEASLDLIR